MITVDAVLGPGVTVIRVTGHGRESADDGMDGVRACAAVSGITQTALLGLTAVAETYPHLVRVNIEETE